MDHDWFALPLLPFFGAWHVLEPEVSMGHVGDRLELERAFSGATVHDMPQPKYMIDSRIDSRRSWECSKPSATDRCTFVTASLAVMPFEQYRVSMG